MIPVLLPRADPVLGFLGQNTWVDLREQPDDPARLAILAAAIRGESPGPVVGGTLTATLATVCPYRGLLYFREEDAAFFFGREVATGHLRDAVTRRSLIAVVGASGSGKSSVVRAGLLPELRRGHDQVWEVATLVPGDRPLYALAAALVPLLEPEMREVDLLIATARLAGELREDGLARLKLRDIVERVLRKQQGTDRLLLVADQWEELYTLTPDEAERRRFTDELLDASSTAPLSVVLTLRGDFVGRVLAYRPLSDRLQDAQVNLGPMTRAELERAVAKPAEQVGLGFEPGLVERILDDVGDEPGNLPLLEFVLKRLWEDRQGGRLLHAAYESMGRLEGAIATKAEAVLEGFTESEQQTVQRVFLELVRPGQGAEDTRRRASLAEIGEASWPVVKRLLVTAPGGVADIPRAGAEPQADQRLRVTPPGSVTAGETVEVAHEALIRHWERLRTWVNSDREFLLWRERFRALLAEWQRRERDAGALLPPALLQEAERWLAERGDKLTADECGYIAEGVAHREREWRAEEERRRADQERREREIRRRSVRKTLAVVLGVAVLAVLATLGASAARRESIRKALMSDLAGGPGDRASEWVPIAAPVGGEFQMGCVRADRQCFANEKRHAARVSRDFELMAHEVTVERFRRYDDAQSTIIGRMLQPRRVGMEDQPDWSERDHPVVSVSWDDARQFCEFVGGRLPTEAEWEYAARGGNADSIYPWGDEYSRDRANGESVGGADKWERSAPVGSFPPNGGLYDMAGNVWEWTSTLYRDDPSRGDAALEDPRSRQARVVRGGSFLNFTWYLRVSLRDFLSPANRDDYLCFRCARDVSP